jgi:glucose-1-phosphate thymidylyltransferase
MISNSYIGPFTSVGHGCQICGTEVEDSIIMDECSILNAGKIVESLIGRNVKIQEGVSKPKGHRIIVGDNSDISL